MMDLLSLGRSIPQGKRATDSGLLARNFFGRGDRIRTCDPLVPNQMRYQAALHPVPKE